MPAVVRKTDKDAGGGAVIGPCAGSVLVNGLPVSVPNDSVSGHGLPPHAAPVTVGGSGTVLAEGQPVQYVGCVDSCGHSRTQGSGDVEVAP